MPSTIIEKDEETDRSTWTPTEDERKRGCRWSRYIQDGLDYRKPYEAAMERGLLLYHGYSKDRTNGTIKAVSPIGRAFIEAKTAEEVNSASGYTFTPGKKSSDEWMCGIVKDVDAHVKRVTKQDIKRTIAYRMKDIQGVSLLRVGYRKLMRKVKHPTKIDKDNNMLEWEEYEVPVYDDLFTDIVSPYNFIVDNLAKSMDDAMYCVHYHHMHYDDFEEMTCGNKLYKNLKHVHPGVYGGFFDRQFQDGQSHRGMAPKKHGVMLVECFHKQRYEYIVYANGVEVYAGGLQDYHGDLPFVSYHNAPSFVRDNGFDRVPRSDDGSDVSLSVNVVGDESFWSQGDLDIISDNIELRTGFMRSSYKGIDLASQNIIATLGDAQFDESTQWRNGSQAIGMMGKFQSVALANPNLSAAEFAFNDTLEQMVLALGIDPRNLIDNKPKTATESQIQQETSKMRLRLGISMIDQSDVRLGTLILKNIEQRYSIPELVRLTGKETEEDLKNFENIRKYKDLDGKEIPYMADRKRMIMTNKKVKEKKRKIMKWSPEEEKLVHDGVSYKYYLTKAEDGVNSFVMRPEWIRSSDISCVPETGKKAGEIKAIRIAQTKELIQLFLETVQLTVSQVPGEEPILKRSDAPNIAYAIRQLVKDMNWDPAKAIGQEKEDDKALFDEKEQALIDQLNQPTNYSDAIADVEQGQLAQPQQQIPNNSQVSL